MPKIIENLRERLLAEARLQVNQLGYGQITVRGIASACGVGVGTVYNYFPSKEALIAEAMMSDWLECSRSMRKDAKAEDQPMNAIRATAAALWKFTSRYQPMWKQYADERKSMHSLEIRHNQIIAEISDAVKETLVRFDLLYEKCLPEVIAELVLLASRTENGFDQIAPVMERILR